MSLARYAVLGRNLKHLLSTTTAPSKQALSQRLSHAWSYRTAAPAHPKAVTYTAEVVSGIMWWWILWHLWHEPEHITGEFPEPDPTQWTNEELGIPPDNFDE
ncbi:NADH dehydrogenase [ubiquinone] 1 beta subcomplex subunit 2, mitochondrial-like [Bradysia coprophila]|uniref:NADH dehydrogenase [ubiquinone] 1 beta subcomplex subunit 2, mitochondrial-like n=1 Tax=Bradysia coprophila TaxID=38358 RepID=UPI00187DD964|nr:NADH dehydrogenase [ubiquinone] 1 beta subcomplex subunit 2, mitochondrial-like [Bradysia coprophila]